MDGMNIVIRRKLKAGESAEVMGFKFSCPDNVAQEMTFMVGYPIKEKPKNPTEPKPRKRKLDTPEEIDDICSIYHMSTQKIVKFSSHQCVSQIARMYNVSTGTINRVLRENSLEFCKKNREAIDEWRSKR